MSLTLYYHPLASFCWKALIALYETEIAFEPRIVDLSNPKERGELAALWPFAKFPVLHDRGRDRVVPESSIIIEYLTQHYGSPLIGRDPELAHEARLLDRFYDLYVHQSMQKIVGDKLRPESQRDAYGVAEARALLDVAYTTLDRQMATRRWAAGEAFSLADCAAAPALYYADRVAPLGDYQNAAAYLQRLHARPSCARVFAEAQPYMHMFPG
ncbi:MAG TPA: glutathione S-transferase family protein [Polyangiales bacterium]|nr:glutathione S-transferase family protein [Polyangiales bacterium]